MWHLIQEMLKDYDVTIEAKEIVGSTALVATI